MADIGRVLGGGEGGQPQRRGGIRWWVLILFGLYFAWYYFSNQQQASFTGRNQLIDTSVEQEAALGLQSYQEILSQSRILQQGEIPGQVREIATKLVAVGPAVEQYLAETQGTPKNTVWESFDWEVNVIESDQVNAFCLPGGKIAVYTGIIPVAGNMSALAAIMGHEIAHALLRHGGERMAQQKLVQIGSIAAGVAVGEMDPQQQRMVMAAIGAGATYGVLLPFSRAHENEADRLGLLLAAHACYDPREAPKLWEHMGQLGGGSAPPEFMSTHPSHSTRIALLNEMMPEALALRGKLCQPER